MSYSTEKSNLAAPPQPSTHHSSSATPSAAEPECSGPCVEEEANAAKSKAALSSVVWSALLTGHFHQQFGHAFRSVAQPVGLCGGRRHLFCGTHRFRACGQAASLRARQGGKSFRPGGDAAAFYHLHLDCPGSCRTSAV